MAASTQASVDVKKKKEKEKEADGDGGTVEVTLNPEAACAPSLEVASEKGNPIPTLQATTVRSLETREVSSERVVRFKTPSILDKSSDVTNIVEHMDFSEEVNGTPEYEVEDERGSALHGDEDEYVDDDDDDNGDGDESEHPGEVSIKKKLWNFFIT